MIFEDLTFEEFDALEFNVFDLYVAFDGYPASYYGEDVLASTVGQGLSFLTVYPRDDGVFTSFDMMQSLGLYRGIAAPDIIPMPVGMWFRFSTNQPHFSPIRNKPHFRMKNNKPHFLTIGARNG